MRTITAVIALMALPGSTAQEPPAEKRHRNAQEFHLRAQQRTGLLVPLYAYPANVQTNAVYNALIELKRRFETVPMWVIVNPASGPGERVDANYTKAIDRLQGAGCVTLGYVTTSYGKRPAGQMEQEIDRWMELYPRVQGLFFDEMRNEDNEAAAAYQAALSEYAHGKGCWPAVANPGTDAPGRYFARNAADVIVVHEGRAWPKEERLKGDYFGGYADFPPFTRGLLLHSQRELDRHALKAARKYVRWIYVTDAEFREGDKHSNPWDRLSTHLEALCEELSK